MPVNPDFWKCFIDDIFLSWTGSDEDLQNFLDFINTVHSTIKFTHSVSSNMVSFLDIAISFKNRYLCIDLYSKPTDSHAYLRFNSCHHFHVKKNLPFSQFLRMRRLCSSEENFEKRCNELAKELCNRGYSKTLIEKERKRAKYRNYKQL